MSWLSLTRGHLKVSICVRKGTYRKVSGVYFDLFCYIKVLGGFGVLLCGVIFLLCFFFF